RGPLGRREATTLQPFGCGLGSPERSGDEAVADPGVRPEGRHLHAVDPRHLDVVGKPWRKIDARSRVTGLTRYADDLSMPRMLAMKLLRSTVAHARIARIDVRAAEALEG